ncbi:MAG: hypothetical protein QN175_04755 [Armatimonadota bacterium]|nr:hypothetical protein [Armatimonadota bacterium]MDR7474305.1 hypothetical protein [Armatimonadota bacterium]
MRRFGRTVALLAGAAGLAAGCARPPALVTFTSARQQFAIAYPKGWDVHRSSEDLRVWFLPAASAEPPAAAEFLLVFTELRPGPLSDDEARYLGLNLLPIHGVSGFRRFKEEEGTVWHRFEVTGTSSGAEWASVGLLVTGRRALRYVVCAKPLDRWREGQKQCDQILKTFRPGPLS